VTRDGKFVNRALTTLTGEPAGDGASRHTAAARPLRRRPTDANFRTGANYRGVARRSCGTMAEEATDHRVTAGSRHNDRPTAVTSTTQQHPPHQQQQQQQWCTVKTAPLPKRPRCCHGLEACPLTKSDLLSDFVINRFLMKLFKTRSLILIMSDII